MSDLLINEPPLQVLPTLATKIGLNEAMFLQQLHYWINNPRTDRRQFEGRWYIRNTFDEWHETNFPFWSVPTIKRIVAKLKKDGLVLSTARLNKMNIDRTQWYTVDYEALELVSEGDKSLTTRKDHIDTLEHYEAPESINMIRPSYHIDTSLEDQIDATNNQRVTESHVITITPACAGKKDLLADGLQLFGQHFGADDLLKISFQETIEAYGLINTVEMMKKLIVDRASKDKPLTWGYVKGALKKQMEENSNGTSNRNGRTYQSSQRKASSGSISKSGASPRVSPKLQRIRANGGFLPGSVPVLPGSD